ncbi:MAG: hypothetical protein IT369_13570 [Candidatus Latescibacteria bacterium]|nr:hypothetical protein [Candidatus Latescibacterota bacterium]
MKIYHTYEELLAQVEKTGRSVQVLGRTPDQAPVVVVRAGGDKLPAIFISAGSHATEHAGVSAAVELVEHLHTDHQVYVIPTRDPVGLGGYAHALSLGLGEKPALDSFAQVENILRREGEVLYEDEGRLLVLLGEYGYASNRPGTHAYDAQWGFYLKLQELQKTRPEVLAPLRGRRLYMTPAQPGVEGTGDLGRAYTLIVSLEGEVLHLNRFHDTLWAPVEPRVTRQLLARIRPGISFDIHESQLMEGRYWLSARHQQDPENEAWEQRAARATIQAIADSGATLAEDDDVLGGVPIEQTWFRKSEKGVYWLDANLRGEGLNLMDFASRVYGMAFGTEMGMYGGFAHRVRLGMLTVQSAVRVFEERYR